MRVVHQTDGQGYGPTGAKGARSTSRPATRSTTLRATKPRTSTGLRDTYPVYHVSELNIAELRPRTPPTSSDRAIEAQNTEFAEQLKVRGEAPREPDEAERAALVVPKEIGKVPHDIERHHDVKVVQNVAIEIPAATAFEDVHGQASSRVHPEDGTSADGWAGIWVGETPGQAWMGQRWGIVGRYLLPMGRSTRFNGTGAQGGYGAHGRRRRTATGTRVEDRR